MSLGLLKEAYLQCFLTVNTRLKSVVSIMSRPLNLGAQPRHSLDRRSMGSNDGLDAVAKRRISVHTRTQTPVLQSSSS
jgi:hypothetical protein